MSDYRFIDATEQMVRNFNEGLITGAKTFRYFKSRPYKVIHNHLTSLLILNTQEIPVAYGHLEREGTNLWLGLAVADDFQCQGLGSLMLGRLISSAMNKNESDITLSVDATNEGARTLYEQHGFVLNEERDQVVIYKRNLS